MKNLKRIILLITIAVIAQKVLFSDFHFTNEQPKNEVAISTTLEL